MNNFLIPTRGVEALSGNYKVSPNKELTKNINTVLPTCLDNLAQEYPDLLELVKVWPNLPEHIKATIAALVKSVHGQE